MRALVRTGLVAGVGLVASVGSVRAQNALLRGQVRDTTGAPVANALLLAMPSGLQVQSNPGGFFMLWELPPGSYVVVVRAIGYSPQQFLTTVKAADTATVLVTLAPAPQMLPELAVEAEGMTYHGRLAGFGERLRSGFSPRSSYLTREDIERANTTQLDQVLLRAGLESSAGRLICPRGGIKGPIVVYLDGARVTGGGAARFDLNSLPLDWVAGIEVYKSVATRPPEFNPTGAGCVVVIWTRDR